MNIKKNQNVVPASNGENLSQEQRKRGWWLWVAFIITMLLFFICSPIIYYLALRLYYGPVQEHTVVFREEVALQNGTEMVLKRSAFFRSDIRTGEREKDLEFTFNVPTNSIAPPPPTWKSRYMPILIDYDESKRLWYVVAARNPYDWHSMWDGSCPPYQLYVAQNELWQRMPFDDRLVGRQANLDFRVFQGVSSSSADSIITIEDKRHSNIYVRRSTNNGQKEAPGLCFYCIEIVGNCSLI